MDAESPQQQQQPSSLAIEGAKAAQAAIASSAPDDLVELLGEEMLRALEQGSMKAEDYRWEVQAWRPHGRPGEAAAARAAHLQQPRDALKATVEAQNQKAREAAQLPAPMAPSTEQPPKKKQK